MGIDNPFQMVVAIILIASVASIIRARYGLDRGSRRRSHGPGLQHLPDPENDALRAEIRALKDRVAVLERLATDSSDTLQREFDKLRHQD